MSTNYPAAVDDGTTLPNPGANAPRNNPSLAGGQTNQNDAIKAIEAKVGTGASTPSSGLIFRGTGIGTSAWGAANLTTDITGTLPVANGGTGLTTLTIPASAILVGTTDAQDVTNKTLHDTFMGETFMSQSATFRNVLLDASMNYLVTELVEVGAAFTLEVPATSTLEVRPFHGPQSFSSAQHDHSSAAGGGVLNPAIAIVNPYKFRVYRHAAYTVTAGALTSLPFDTKSYDTSNNVDIVTNQGRFTVPVTGVYHFDGRLSITPAAGGRLIGFIRKNGAALNDANLSRGNDNSQGSSPIGSSASDTIMCNKGDYVEFAYYSVNATTTETGDDISYFSGFLVSI